jgi:hypothetical protein
MPSDSYDSANHRDQPTYWFAVLEIARERSDFAQAAEAQRQLNRLGVRVHYQRPGPVAARGGHDA